LSLQRTSKFEPTGDLNAQKNQKVYKILKKLPALLGDPNKMVILVFDL